MISVVNKCFAVLLPLGEPVRRGLIMGLWNSHTSVGNILGSLIAGYWVSSNWGLSFIIPGLIIAAMGVICYLFLIERKLNLLLNVFFLYCLFFMFCLVIYVGCWFLGWCFSSIRQLKKDKFHMLVFPLQIQMTWKVCMLRICLHQRVWVELFGYTICFHELLCVIFNNLLLSGFI